MSIASSARPTNAGRVPDLTGRRPTPNAPARPQVTSRAMRPMQAESCPVNVGDGERLLSAVGGGALAVYGLTRGDVGGLALAALGGGLVYRGVSGHCSCYSALGVSTADDRTPTTAVRPDHGVKVEHTVTINRPAADLYRYWRNLENLPQFMRHLASVKVDGNRSHWVAKAPLGMTVEWDAEVITERPNELIGWRSLPGSTVDTAGSVHFRSSAGGRGTEVTVTLKYDPPAGQVGATLARWLGEAPEEMIAEDLNA